MDLGLQGRRVLVTGASGKIGSATATAFGAEGARVAVAYHGNEEGALRVASEVETGGGKAITVRLDLADSDSVGAAVSAVEQEFGGIDVLVNNAVAWPPRGPGRTLFEDVPMENLSTSVQANVIGQYVLSQAAVRSMRPNGWGRIVHLSTGLVEDGFPGSTTYTTPKSALHGLTRSMSRELAPAGILTNLVMAGFVPPPNVPAPVLEQTSLSAAIGRASQPQEIANLIVFLCSAANTNITGELIRADGHFLTRDS